jgi:hypothetical protein
MISRQKARGRLRYWQRRLGLTEYKIRVRFDRPAEEHRAHCHLWDAEYLEGEIYFNLPRIGSLRELDELCLHELSHVAFWPIGAIADKMAGKSHKLRRLVLLAEEQSTTRLERILLHAFGLTVQDAA